MNKFRESLILSGVQNTNNPAYTKNSFYTEGMLVYLELVNGKTGKKKKKKI